VSGGAPGSIVIGRDSNAPITMTVLHGEFRQIGEIAPDPVAALGNLAPDEIVDRDWAYEAIDEFLRAEPHGYVLIEAAAGMGKTTLAASLALRNDYPAHFGEVTRQDTAGVALVRLAAQLIKRYELVDFAPGGVLPASAGDPDWFGGVLAASATVARQKGDRLILVIDGVDEMVPHPSGRPLGLPTVLPESVYVILTCRTGTRLRLGTPLHRLQITAGQAENLSDVRLFVERYADRHLADQLAEAGLSRSSFVDAMTAASGGLWVYLKHLCDDVRHRRRRIDGLDGLPRDLNQYYLDNLQGCLVECADRGSGVRLLAALAASRDPVSVATLAAFAAVSPQDASNMCRGPLMPLLRERRDTEPVRYSMYHRSLAEVLTGTTPAGSSGHQAIADELREAVRPAHQRIYGHYLQLFGGLDEGLPVLADDPAAAEVDQRYPLHHLVEHLHAAGAQRQLHHLLTVRAPMRGTWGGVWFIAHEQAGTLYRYLTDVDSARSAAERETERSLDRDGIAESLGAEVRYALLTAVAAERMQQIPNVLLRRLVETGQWDLAQAIGYALALPAPAEQARALAELYPLASAPEQDRIRAIVLQNANYLGVDTLACVARTLPAADLPRLLEAARRTGSPLNVERFLGAIASTHRAALAELAKPELILAGGRVLRQLAAKADPVGWAAATILHGDRFASIDDLRVTATLLLAGRMPTAESDTVVAICAAYVGSKTKLSDQARCLVPLLRLAPSEPITKLASDLLIRCRDVDDDERAGILRETVADLPATLLPSALAMTQTLPPALAAPILASLAPRLAPADFATAMRLIRTFPSDRATIDCLAGIASSVPAELFPIALATTTALGDDHRDQVLAALAGNVPVEHAGTMLGHVQGVVRPEHRSVALARLLPSLPARQARQIGSQALQALTELREPERTRAADIVIPLLPTAALLREALAALQDRDHDYSRLLASAALAPYLPERTRHENSVRVLTQFVPARMGKGEGTHHFLETIIDQLPPSALERAADLARSIQWSDLRLTSLSRVAARAQGNLRKKLLAEALTSFEKQWDHAAFRLLAPIVSGQQRHRLVAAAVKTLAAGTYYNRWIGLEVVLDWIPESERGDLVTQAIDDAIGTPGKLSSPALGIAARLTKAHAPERLDSLLESIATMSDAKRGPALAAVAEVLSEEQAATALRLVRQLSGHEARDAVTALVPRLPRAATEALYAELRTESSTWAGQFEMEQGVHALVACYLSVAGDLPKGNAIEAGREILRAVSALGNPAKRVGLLADLMSEAPAELLGEAMRLCCAAVPDTRLERTTLPNSLARAVRCAHQRAGGKADRGVLQLFRHALQTADTLFLLQVVIPETADLIADYGGEQAVEECLPPPYLAD
jgi:hypothetical protein